MMKYKIIYRIWINNRVLILGILIFKENNKNLLAELNYLNQKLSRRLMWLSYPFSEMKGD